MTDTGHRRPETEARPPHYTAQTEIRAEQCTVRKLRSLCRHDNLGSKISNLGQVLGPQATLPSKDGAKRRSVHCCKLGEFRRTFWLGAKIGSFVEVLGLYGQVEWCLAIWRHVVLIYSNERLLEPSEMLE